MDNDYNPLKTVRKRVLLAPGYYTAVFSELITKKGKDKEGKEVDKIIFIFECEGKGGTGKVFKYVYPGTNANSKFVQTLRQLAPDLYKDELEGDADGLWDFAKGLIGRSYKAFVSQNEGWNNIESLMPLVIEEEEAAAPPPVQDDIPF
jgi:hypothetical protein